MLTTDDLKSLREAGMSDDDILEGVRKHAPDLGGDIEGLKKEGVPSGFILEGISKHYKAQPKKERDTSFSSALSQGAADALTGLGKTAEAAGWDTTSQVLGAVAQPLQRPDYERASEGFSKPKEGDFTIGGYAPGYIPRMVVEGAPGMAADIGATAVGTAVGGPVVGAIAGAGSYGAREAGRSIEKVAGNNNRSLKDATTQDIVQGVGTTAAESVVNQIGLKGVKVPMLPKVEGILGQTAKTTGQAAVQTGTAMLKEGGTEAGQEIINQVGTGIGTEKGVNMDWDAVVASGAAGGATGGAIRGAGAARDVYQNQKFSDIGGDQAAALAETMRSFGADPKNGKEAFDLITKTDTHLDKQIDGKLTELRTYFDHQNSLSPSGGVKLRTQIEELVTGLGKKLTNVDDQIEALKGSDLVKNDAGQKLVAALEQKAALNKLRSKGREKNGEFVGGVAKNLEWLNPLNILKSGTSAAVLGAGAGAYAGVSGLSALAQMGVSMGAVGKAAALPIGVYSAARLLDKATGNRNPTAEFLKRNTDAPASLPVMPDFRWEQQQEKERQQKFDWDYRDAKAEERERNEQLRHQERMKADAERQQREEDRRLEHEAYQERGMRNKREKAEAKRAAEEEAAFNKQYDADWKLAHEINLAREAKRKLEEQQAQQEQEGYIPPDIQRKAKAIMSVARLENAERTRTSKAEAKAAKDAERQSQEEWYGVKQGVQAINWRENQKNKALDQDRRDAENTNRDLDDADKRQMTEARKGVQAIKSRESMKGKQAQQDAKDQRKKDADAKKAEKDEWSDMTAKSRALMKVKRMEAGEAKRETAEAQRADKDEWSEVTGKARAIMGKERLKERTEAREMSDARKGVQAIKNRESEKGKQAQAEAKDKRRQESEAKQAEKDEWSEVKANARAIMGKEKLKAREETREMSEARKGVQAIKGRESMKGQQAAADAKEQRRKETEAKRAEQDEWSDLTSKSRALMSVKRMEAAEKKRETAEVLRTEKEKEDATRRSIAELTKSGRKALAIDDARGKANMTGIKLRERLKAKNLGEEPVDIAAAIRNAEPIKGTTTEQPKSTAKTAKEALKKLNGDQGSQEAPKPAGEARRASGEYHEYRGYRFPLPDTMRNRGGYIANLERNQDEIAGHIEKAIGQGLSIKEGVDPKPYIDAIHTARNAEDGGIAIRRFLDLVPKSERREAERALAPIVLIYSKAKQGD